MWYLSNFSPGRIWHNDVLWCGALLESRIMHGVYKKKMLSLVGIPRLVYIRCQDMNWTLYRRYCLRDANVKQPERQIYLFTLFFAVKRILALLRSTKINVFTCLFLQLLNEIIKRYISGSLDGDSSYKWPYMTKKQSNIFPTYSYNEDFYYPTWVSWKVYHQKSLYDDFIFAVDDVFTNGIHSLKDWWKTFVNHLENSVEKWTSFSYIQWENLAQSWKFQLNFVFSLSYCSSFLSLFYTVYEKFHTFALFRIQKTYRIIYIDLHQ